MLTAPLNFVSDIGRRTIELTEFLGNYFVFCLEVMGRVLSPPWRFKMIMDQAVLIGVKSFPIAALTSIFVGMVMVLQTGVQLAKFGSKTYVPGISFIANAREMVPAFCAIVVGARVAASITAEIGTMRVTEQIDAMDTLNVDTKRYLCVPRIIAMTFMLPAISTLCLVVGYFGGQIVGASALGIDPLQYYSTTLAFAKVPDIAGGISKTFVFGLLIALSGCYYGFNTSGGAAGVGRATTNSVVFALIQILVFDYLLTSVILYITGQ
jgi:phospholipid/cholesterol/gamma-HCH transport system permease protein